MSDHKTANDPLTAIVSALIEFLSFQLERRISRIVDQAFAKVNKWQEKREYERIKKQYERYCAERRKKR